MGGIEYRQGDAAEFTAENDVAKLHVVNDKAQRWGPLGFAKALRSTHSGAYDDYTWWKNENPKEKRHWVQFIW